MVKLTLLGSLAVLLAWCAISEEAAIKKADPLQQAVRESSYSSTETEEESPDSSPETEAESSDSSSSSDSESSDSSSDSLSSSDSSSESSSECSKSSTETVIQPVYPVEPVIEEEKRKAGGELTRILRKLIHA